MVRVLLPERRTVLRRRLRRLRRPARLFALRRTTPVSDEWGFDRGTPVDRHFIEEFLARNRGDIRGRVLEVMDARYTERFGSGVTQSDVVDIDPANTRATIVADLASADAIATASFDCVVVTQTLQFVLDPRAAIRHLWRILRPGGTLLCTVPTTSRFSTRTVANDYWRFTPAGCVALFGEIIPEESLTIEAPGNVLTATAFLRGLAVEELPAKALREMDPRFPLLVLIRATKPCD
jgi:SAM-dependent methyltransferase